MAYLAKSPVQWIGARRTESLVAAQSNVFGDKNARAFSEQLICHGKAFVESSKNQLRFPAAWKLGSDFPTFEIANRDPTPRLIALLQCFGAHIEQAHRNSR